jgi:hypothetical protein
MHCRPDFPALPATSYAPDPSRLYRGAKVSQESEQAGGFRRRDTTPVKAIS